MYAQVIKKMQTSSSKSRNIE